MNAWGAAVGLGRPDRVLLDFSANAATLARSHRELLDRLHVNLFVDQAAGGREIIVAARMRELATRDDLGVLARASLGVHT